MRPTPMFMFACAVAAISGAVGGAAIDTQPIQRAGVGAPGYMLEPASFSSGDDEIAAQPALPDHYAMDTPIGRIEVAELAANGLFSQRRFGWRETIDMPPPAPPAAEPLVWDEPSEDQRVAEKDAEDPGLEAELPEAGGARLIQVAASGVAG